MRRALLKETTQTAQPQQQPPISHRALELPCLRSLQPFIASLVGTALGVLPADHRYYSDIHTPGNDLPPRHSPGQTLNNLKFILQHEPPFADCRKVWILNRLVDPAKETAIIKLLRDWHQPFIRIPFDSVVYARTAFRYNDFLVDDFFYVADYRRATQNLRRMAVDHTYHDKNLYVMNNNGARNLALEDGRFASRWVLPFDGNCFISAQAWQEIRASLEAHGKQFKYFVVPMVRSSECVARWFSKSPPSSSDWKQARLTNNTVLLEPNARPEASDEPQIIFRHDAMERFNESMRYGRRSKGMIGEWRKNKPSMSLGSAHVSLSLLSVELLWRLGVIGQWETWHFYPWEHRSWSSSPDVGNFHRCGWVARLFSGKSEQESVGSSKARKYNRMLAIQRFIDDLDEKVTRSTFSADSLFAMDAKTLEQNRHDYWTGGECITRRIQAFMRGSAFDRIQRMDQHDALSTYYLYATAAEAVAHPESASMLLRQLQYDITWNTLAFHFTTYEYYGKRARDLLSQWFLHPIDARLMAGNLARHRNIAPLLRNHATAAILALLDNPTTMFGFVANATAVFSGDLKKQTPALHVHALLDAVRLLFEARLLSKRDTTHMRAWASDTLDYLQNGMEVSHETYTSDRSYFDLQCAALAAFVDDAVSFLHIIDRAKTRAILVVTDLHHIIEEGPTFWEALHGTHADDTRLLNVHRYMDLLNFGARGGVSGWDYQVLGIPLSEHFAELAEQVALFIFRPSVAGSVKLRMLSLLFGFYGSESRAEWWNVYFDVTATLKDSEMQMMEFGVSPFWYLDK